MAAGKLCWPLLLLFALLARTLCLPVTDATKAIYGRTSKRDIKGHAHDSHEVRRMHKYVMNRWMGVIVVRPAPCPAGTRLDMLGLCRPVAGRPGAEPPPLSALFLSEYGYSDFDSHAPRDRRTRLARMDNEVMEMLQRARESGVTTELRRHP